MRLLLSTDSVGGVWDHTATLSAALSQAGHAVLLACVGEPSSDQLDQLAEDVEIERHSAPLEWMRPPPRELHVTAEWLNALARRWGAEVVHLNQMAYPGLVEFEAPCVVAVHSDVCSWFAEVLYAPVPPEWSAYVGQVRAGLSAADLIVAPSQYQADRVRRYFGHTADAVIHNAAEVTRSIGTEKNHPLLISAGRAWDEAKGMMVLERALEILGDAAPAAHLLGAMEGPEGERFEARRLICEGLQSRSRVQEWMDRASLYVAPSVYEPFGLAPLEAALHGCALILSDIGSFRELWDGCAEFFPRGSAPALARLIRKLSEDPERSRALGMAAQARARERYAVEIFVERYLALYGSLLGTTRQGARVRDNVLEPFPPLRPRPTPR